MYIYIYTYSELQVLRPLVVACFRGPNSLNAKCREDIHNTNNDDNSSNDSNMIDISISISTSNHNTQKCIIRFVDDPKRDDSGWCRA